MASGSVAVSQTEPTTIENTSTALQQAQAVIQPAMAATPLDGTEVPGSWRARPLALVGVAGLDLLNNAVHSAVWDGLANNRRAERAALRFKPLPNTLEFPVVKPQRNSYEWYIPKGILKRNWIEKRLALVPSVVVVFYDLEWSDPQWNEKIIECASRVQSIRAALEGHATRVAVVVVQGAVAPPPSEYLLGAERAQALCAACEIQSKALFVLPHGDHLMGYIVRLENAFYDLAQNFYHHETKIVKSHRDHLNKTNHQYLFVRHQFKLGFLNELKQDLSTAHKHYVHAYNNLLEVRVVETNTHEVKTVAGYLNYKLCKLLFALNLPRDAIAQLRSHIERYKNRIGTAELLFEHYAWIARQYSAFGELFDEAIRSGLPAIQSQHPGFYYQQAAQFTAKRRQAMKSLCSGALEYPPPPDPLEGTVEFYGQRPWRPGRLSADPHDPQKEQAAIVALQFRESEFNHSAMIISFLGNAISQFKTFHSPRMRKQLVVEMANEYYLCSDYGKALTLLTHMLWDYRREKWWYLASHVLNRALQCAYLSSKIQDYLNLAIEALSKHIVVPTNDKERIYHNIMSVLSLNIPNPEPDLPNSAVTNAVEVWKGAIEKEPFSIAIDMSTISAFLEIKTRFTKSVYKLDDDVSIELFVRSTYPSSVQVQHLSVTVSSRLETIEIPVTDDRSSTLTLKGGEVKKLMCQFKPNPEDSGSELQIKNISFILGEAKRKLALNFNMSSTNTQDTTIHPELVHFSTAAKSDHEFDSIVSTTLSHVTSRESNVVLTVINEVPALQGEWFGTTLDLLNNEECHIHNVKMELSLVSSSDNPNPESVSELSFLPGSQTEPLQLSVDSMPPFTNYVKAFYLKSNRTMTVTVLLKVTYFLDNQTVESSKDFTVKITVVKPFEVSVKFVSMSFQTIDKSFVDDPFIVMPEIKILSPWKLLIEDTDLEVTECYSYADEDKPQSCLKDLQVGEGTITADAFCIYPNTCPKETPVRVGLYNIKWKRVASGLSPLAWESVMSSSALSGISIQNCSVSIKLEMPEKVQLQTSISLKCTLKGTVDTPVSLIVGVEGTDAFMFSGYKKRSVTILPDADEELCYNLHPLVCGNTNPPKLNPSIDVEELPSTENSIMQELFNKSVPQNVYVMPKFKN